MVEAGGEGGDLLGREIIFALKTDMRVLVLDEIGGGYLGDLLELLDGLDEAV